METQEPDLTSNLVAEKNESASATVLIEPKGAYATKQFRLFATVANQSGVDSDGESKPISMWHDVDLYPESNVINMICEVRHFDFYPHV
jgi:hypothetical protein